MESSSQDKTLPATAQRLKKARDDGQVARSKDLSNLAVLGGGALVLLAFAPMGFDKLRTSLRSQLTFDHQALQQPELALQRLVDGFSQGLMLYLPLGLIVLAIAMAAVVASGSWALSTKPIVPDLNRINPLAGIGLETEGSFGHAAGVERPGELGSHRGRSPTSRRSRGVAASRSCNAARAPASGSGAAPSRKLTLRATVCASAGCPAG